MKWIRLFGPHCIMLVYRLLKHKNQTLKMSIVALIFVALCFEKFAG